MVAVIDLNENLPIPLIPWPLVQPPLTLVPIPTSKPANINKIKEFNELEAFAKELDGIDQLQKWDGAYYAEKLKEKLFDLDDEKLKPYFELDKVIKGVFTVAKKLYELHFEEVTNIDTYHEDVKTFRVTDKDGELEYAVLGAGITVKTMNDSTYKVMPVYVVEGDEVQHMDTEIKELGIKFSFDRINYETNRPVIIASEHKEEEVPFILVKAVIFPWINLLWIGSILMALGTVIAVVQRLKRS